MTDEQAPPADGKRPRSRRRTTAAAVDAAADSPSTDLLPDGDGASGERPVGLRVSRSSAVRSPARRSADRQPEAEPPPHMPGDRALPVVGTSTIDGAPAEYDDGIQWLQNGLKRHWWGTTVALVFGWTGAWLALWGAAIGAVVGILVALNLFSTTALGVDVTKLGGGQAITIVSVLSGMFFGAIGGVVVVLRLILFSTSWEFTVSIGSGIVISVIVTVVMAGYERLGLRLRGYRRLSRDEVRRIAPLVRDVAEANNLDGLPRFAMSDQVIPNAWTHMRTIVLTTGLLQSLDDPELRAVITHELAHWRSGDSVGLRIVWAAAWPIAITFNVGMLIAGKKPSVPLPVPGWVRGFLVILSWIIAWPAWVVIKLFIAPAVAATQRGYEYAADRAAASLGYAPAMISALRKMTAYEGGRTNWEQALTATHPPTELRIEALQAPKPDDAEYQEDELRGPTLKEFGRFLRALNR